MSNDITISTLASRSLATQAMAKREHWKTDSRSEHEGFGYFYDSVGEKIDAVVENYQGMFNCRIDYFEVNTEKIKDLRKYLIDEADWIEANLTILANGSENISNLIQSLISVYTQTEYFLSLK